MKYDISLKIDLTKLIEQIEESNNLSDIDFYNNLSSLFETKKELLDILDSIKSLESKIYQQIDSRAKVTIGSDWSAIKGNNFKITKSYSGQSYEITGEPDKAYLKITESPDSSKITEYRNLHDNKLPQGFGINENRNSSIRIKFV